ncbi:hypothetical protein AHF37_11853 [Paragonimus kellicotti]|nr:hypothetical protein AHF37_11853 [Paragonimus kellicotti]
MFERYPDNTTIGMLWPDDPDFFAIVHPHWHNFPVPDPMYNYLIGVLITIISCTAMAGNLLVIGLFSWSFLLLFNLSALMVSAKAKVGTYQANTVHLKPNELVTHLGS